VLSLPEREAEGSGHDVENRSGKPSERMDVLGQVPDAENTASQVLAATGSAGGNEPRGAT